MNDHAPSLVRDLIRMSSSLHPGIDAKTFEHFVTKLKVELPPLFRDLVLAANGGEFVFARHENAFVPESCGDMTFDELWDYVLLTLKESCPEFERDHFIGKYFPLGDDYSGDQLVIDLMSAPQFRVLSSTFEVGDPGTYEEVSPTFRAFLEEAVAEASKSGEDADLVRGAPEELPPDPSDSSAIEQVKAMLEQETSIKVAPVRWGHQLKGPTQLWFRISGSMTFRFRVTHEAIPLSRFGCMVLRTARGPTLVTRLNDAFVTSQYKNFDLLNDAVNDLPRGATNDSPLDMESCRLTKNAEQLVIAETSYLEMTAPVKTNMQSVAVMMRHADAVHWLRFDLEDLPSKSASDQSINWLLKFGTAWFSYPSGE